MSTAMLPDMLDFAWQQPAPSQLRDLGLDGAGYSGSARVTAAWLAELLGYGRLFLGIQETYSTRSQEGFEAGAADCGFAESRFDEIGYPRSLPILVVVSDGNSADAWWSLAYAQGWASRAVRRFFPYGAPGVTLPFLEVGGALLIPGDMVPRTWGPHDRTLIVQEIGGAPIDGTDYDTVVGDWTGGAAAPPPAAARKASEMELIVGPLFGGERRAYLVEPGGAVLGRWDSTGADSDTFVGIPISAVVPAGATVNQFDATKPEHVAMFAKLMTLYDARMTGTTPVAGATPAQVKAAHDTAAALTSTATALTAAAGGLNAAFPT